MRSSKDLRGILAAFNDTDIPVWIVGNFENKSEYEYLKSHAVNNFHIENRALDYDEYYRLIAESRFLIMPYDMSFCKDATSGILLKNIFLNSIPIAPLKLLAYNSVSGIGYERLTDLPKTYLALLEFGEKVENHPEDCDAGSFLKG
jgi:hypothetical protein